MDTDSAAVPFRGVVGWLDADEPTHRGALWGLAITGLAAATVAVVGTVRGGAPAVAGALPLAWASVGWQTGRLPAADRERFVGLLFAVGATALLAATACRAARSLQTAALFEAVWFTLLVVIAAAFLVATGAALVVSAALAVADHYGGPRLPGETAERTLEEAGTDQ